jgi:hypothetical protein
MHPIMGLEVSRQRDIERRQEAAMGHRMAIDTLDQSERSTPRLAGRTVGLGVAAVVAAAVAIPIAGFWMVAVATGLLAAISGAGLLAQRERRRAALDRLVELEPLAAPPDRHAGAVGQHRAHLAAARNRCALARTVRSSVADGRVARFGSPGARALAREPELAQRVAGRLEADGEGHVLAIAVERLLRTGGDGDVALDRVRRLVA